MCVIVKCEVKAQIIKLIQDQIIVGVYLSFAPPPIRCQRPPPPGEDEWLNCRPQSALNTHCTWLLVRRVAMRASGDCGSGAITTREELQQRVNEWAIPQNAHLFSAFRPQQSEENKQ